MCTLMMYDCCFVVHSIYITQFLMLVFCLSTLFVFHFDRIQHKFTCSTVGF